MKTRIWTAPTRIFHWFLVIGFATAYILGDLHVPKNIHFAFGAFVGTLLLMRIIYGFIGPRYSRFKDFPLSIKRQYNFIINLPKKNTEEYAGHNPAASGVMLAIIIVGVVTACAGFLVYATARQWVNWGIDRHALGEIHGFLANLFLFLVIMHLVGLVADVVFHSKTGTIKSMFTGYKNIEAAPAECRKADGWFLIFWLIIPLLAFYLAWNLPVKKAPEKQEQEVEHVDND